MRKFEHSRALDQVLKAYVVSRRPEVTYSVVQELKRRNALRTALAGRNEKELTMVLGYVNK